MKLRFMGKLKSNGKEMHIKLISFVIIGITLSACTPSDIQNTTKNTASATDVHEHNHAQPLITAQTITLLKEEECLAENQESCLNLNIHYLQTNQDWLNNYLLKELRTVLSEEPAEEKDLSQLATDYVAAARKELQDSAREDNNLNIGLDYQQYFKGNYGKIVRVEIKTESHNGGTRGFFDTRYLNFNTQTQKPLHIIDIRETGTEQALADKLTALYRQHEVFKDAEMTEAEITEFIQKNWVDSINEAFANPDNFLFTPEGILFHFSPNTIGPYVMGEIELLLPYSEAQGLIRSEWLNP